MPEKATHQTTYGRETLAGFQIQLQAAFELALWRFINDQYGPECDALGVPVGHLKHKVLLSNKRAAAGAINHAVEVIAAVLDSAELREEFTRLEEARRKALFVKNAKGFMGVSS